MTKFYSIVKQTSRTMLPIITYKMRITHVYTHVLYFLTHPVPVSNYEFPWDTCRLREEKKRKSEGERNHNYGVMREKRKEGGIYMVLSVSHPGAWPRGLARVQHENFNDPSG